MRTLVLSTMLVVALASQGKTERQADDVETAKAIIKKAIEAMGAKDSERPILMTWKDTGTFLGGETSMPYSGEWAYHGPDKYRFDVHGEMNGRKLEFLVVVNGNKAWMNSQGHTHEMTGPQLEQTIAQVHQFRILQLVPLLHDNCYKLSTAGEEYVGDKKALVVKVGQNKMPPVTLYFEKVSGLLIKSEMPVKDELQGWKEIVEENLFDDYQEIGGRKFFHNMRVLREGRIVIEASLKDQKIPTRLDPRLFEKP